MADIRLLERTLQQNVAWNKARINFAAKFIVALIQVRSVNLAEVAGVFAGGALKGSHYKRLQRFLRHFELPDASLAAFVLRLLGVPRPWSPAAVRGSERQKGFGQGKIGKRRTSHQIRTDRITGFLCHANREIL
jgi:hypothetical protein